MTYPVSLGGRLSGICSNSQHVRSVPQMLTPDLPGGRRPPVPRRLWDSTVPPKGVRTSKLVRVLHPLGGSGRAGQARLCCLTPHRHVAHTFCCGNFQHWQRRKAGMADPGQSRHFSPGSLALSSHAAPIPSSQSKFQTWYHCIQKYVRMSSPRNKDFTNT